MQLTEYAAARVLSQNSTKLYHFASLSLVRQVTSSRAASPLPCSLDDDRFAWTCKSSSTDSAPWRRGSRTHCRQSRPTPQSHKVRSALGAGDGIISGIKRRRVVEYGPCPGCAKGTYELVEASEAGVAHPTGGHFVGNGSPQPAGARTPTSLPVSYLRPCTSERSTLSSTCDMAEFGPRATNLCRRLQTRGQGDLPDTPNGKGTPERAWS